MSNGFVVLMGMGTVFFGLICIVFLCYIMSLIVRKAVKEKPAPAAAAPVKSAPAPVANKGELIAAVAAAVAEELGTDVSGIRIHSFKQV